MKATLAVGHFLGKEKFNCAQAVLKAFQQESGVSDCAIKAASKAGKGKAMDGACGALHGVRVLLDRDDRLINLEKQFADKAGSLRCREIRKSKSLTCKQCVNLAASLMEENMDALRPNDPDFTKALHERVKTMLANTKS